MSAGAARIAGPRFTQPQPNPPPALGHAGGERALGNAHEVDIDQLRPDPGQPRKQMEPDRLAELAASITAHGLLQPILARAEGFDDLGDMRYRIIAGGRRYAAIRLAIEQTSDAALQARLRRVPVLISGSEQSATRVLQLIENLQREDLPPVEEARALKELMTLEGLSLRGLAARVHRSLGYVDERLRLLRHEEVADAVEAGVVTKSAGAAIASLPEHEERHAWLVRARAGEAVQPAEIYAGKVAARAARRIGANAVPVARRPSSEAAAAPTVQTLDTAPTQPGDPPAPCVGEAGPLAGGPDPSERDQALRAALDALLARRRPAEEAALRRMVREALELGATQGRTCAEVLPFISTLE